MGPTKPQTNRGTETVAALALLLACVWGAAGSAEHALSEVWSESDGLQMKYSTDHDDLVGAKGSELTLSSSNLLNKAAGDSSQQEAESQQPSESGDANDDSATGDTSDTSDSAAPSTPPSSSSSSSSSSPQAADLDERSNSGDSPSEGADGEEGADSSGRPLEVASARRQPSDAGSNGNGNGNGNSNNRNYNQEQQALSFASALEQTNDEGAAGEQANADETADRQAANRFRAPGRLFKEAVRIGESSRAAEGGEQEAESEELPAGVGEPDWPQAGAADGLEEERAAGSAPNQRLAGAKQAKSAASPSAYKQLAYFRGVDQAERGQRSPAAAKQESPDSVRDNFISPGHYPGSMAHLTQAASELRTQTAPSATSTTTTSRPASQAASRAPQPASDTGAPTGPPTTQVTPEPEAAAEGQQIMAPILPATSTMAPPPAGQLKRFKFRKYR